MTEWDVNKYNVVLKDHKNEVLESRKTMDGYKKGTMGFGPMPQIVGQWSQDQKDWVRALEAWEAELSKKRPSLKKLHSLWDEAGKCMRRRTGCGSRRQRTPPYALEAPRGEVGGARGAAATRSRRQRWRRGVRSALQAVEPKRRLRRATARVMMTLRQSKLGIDSSSLGWRGSRGHKDPAGRPSAP